MTDAEPSSGVATAWAAVPVPMPAPGRVVGFEAFGRKLLLCNADGEPFVVANECPHVRVPLEGGVLQGFVLQCPLHGGRIDVRDGTPAGKPIRTRVACYPTRQQGGRLEVASERE